MRQNVLQNVLGQFITKCSSLLQNEMKRLLHFGHLLQNAPLLQNVAQQTLSLRRWSTSDLLTLRVTT